MKAIKEMRAFRKDTSGSETIPELKVFGERIKTVPGKHGLNAFSNTDLDDLVKQHQIEHILLAGAVTSVCIDSTGRSDYERNLNVHILSDCTSARTSIEQQFYCERIFPIYAEVLTSHQCVEQLSKVG